MFMKKKLLLHACCAPCLSSVMEQLIDTYDVSVYYYNPSIYPRAEYVKRWKEIKKLNKKVYNNKLKLISGKYQPKSFYKSIAGMEGCKEGEARCFLCYEMRLLQTAKYASAKGYDLFTTTMSVSPHKNHEVLNAIGKKIETQTQVKYVAANFKKNNGFLRVAQLCKEYKIYRQSYCGCKYSIR